MSHPTTGRRRPMASGTVRRHPAPRPARRTLAAGLAALLVSCPALAGCTGDPDTSSSTGGLPLVLPTPTSMQARSGQDFTLTADSCITAPAEAEAPAAYLSEVLRPATGFDLPVTEGRCPEATGSAIALRLEASEGEAPVPGGYELSAGAQAVDITAADVEGLYNGVQTLRQLMGAPVFATEKGTGPFTVPAVAVSDAPAWEYRGFMLDVARLYYPVADVKRVIDHIALYKYNVLRLHLTDDQGWRLVVDAYPALTEIGATTQEGVDPQAETRWYYTKEEYRDIVAYAAARSVTVAVEVDGPGHTTAAQASVPELNCDDQALDPYSGYEVGISLYCLSDEAHRAQVETFLTTVWAEILADTPGQWMHGGGDETPSAPVEEYQAYVAMMGRIAEKNGKRLLGWAELAQGTLPAGAAVQYWGLDADARTVGQVESPAVGLVRSALDQGADIIMSPADRSYVDQKYDSGTTMGLQWAGPTSVERSYDWDPATLLSDGETPLIPAEKLLGVEATLFSDRSWQPSDQFPPNPDQFVAPAYYADYMMFPRTAALAEVAWKGSDKADWKTFRPRLAAQDTIWEAMGIDYYRSDEVW